MPIFNRMDLSIMQDIFRNIGGKRNAGQIRFDITNFGNLLNHNWGVGERLVLPTTAANGAQISDEPRRGPGDGARHLSPRSREQ